MVKKNVLSPETVTRGRKYQQIDGLKGRASTEIIGKEEVVF